ncbi:hypothetical protein ACFPIF_15485 [Brevundimonas faecalis]|uniref:hypothetical protein n=1 Tax=Brevundimonas faecalis TaxID=947378 RepID=UPI00360A6951
MVIAGLMAAALAQTAAQEIEALRPYRLCVETAARYVAFSDERLVDAGRLATSLCDDQRLEAEAALGHVVGEDASISRVESWTNVLSRRAERIAFRVRVCKQDIGCNTFLDARGIIDPGPYRGPSSAMPQR